MRLLLCNDSDPCAAWLAAGLTARGRPVEVVSAAELVEGARWIHRVGDAGAEVRIDLRDGRHLDSRDLSLVINRIAYPPVHLLPSSAADRAYAAQELYAFWLSWLEGLPCPVLNRPSPIGLAGAWLSREEWLLLAGRSGLNAEMMHSDDPPEMDAAFPETQSLWVVCEAVFGASEATGMVPGARLMAEAVGVQILELHLARDAEGALCVGGASPLGDLRSIGEPVLRHLARMFA